MKKETIAATVMLLITGSTKAEAVFGTEELKLHIDSMPAMLVENRPITLYENTFDTGTEMSLSPAKEAIDVSKAIKPYKFMDDMTFVGVPLFVAGIIAKNEKASFRQDYNNTSTKSRLIKYNFHSEIDNYTQYAPMLLSTGLNLSGVEGRSSFGRYLASGAMSYAIMAAIVNPIKYTTKEMRPDGSTRNSWPSGHTATAFVSATILHKEYGLTRSPWYSVAGYGIATATGVMRVLNNRHWVSDVLSGAGVGIFATELGYGLCDLIFKEKGLKRNDLVYTHNIIENPSFFGISMGIGLGSKTLDFDTNLTGEDEEVIGAGESMPVVLKFRSATVVDAEGAYFFNKYIGVGGRLRVRSNPIKGWSNLTSIMQEETDKITEIFKKDADYAEMIKSQTLTIESDHITEFTGDVGVYFNFPLSDRFALGSKLLVGRSIIQDLNLKGNASGYQLAAYDENNNKLTFDEITKLWIDDINAPVDIRSTGESYDMEWDYFNISGNNTIKFGTGISLTYAYKSFFSWKVFFDYDYTRKTYTMEYNPYPIFKYGGPFLEEIGEPYTKSIKKHMNTFVIGGSFCISF